MKILSLGLIGFLMLVGGLACEAPALASIPDALQGKSGQRVELDRVRISFEV